MPITDTSNFLHGPTSASAHDGHTSVLTCYALHIQTLIPTSPDPLPPPFGFTIQQPEFPLHDQFLPSPPSFSLHSTYLGMESPFAVEIIHERYIYFPPIAAFYTAFNFTGVNDLRALVSDKLNICFFFNRRAVGFYLDSGS